MNIFWHLLSLFTGFLSRIGIYNPVFYYGCPNSDKAKKLQLKKTLFK